MKLKSFLKRLIFLEEQVEKVNSSLNKEILVFEDLFGHHSLRIGGVSQSGGLVIDIWKKAVGEIRNLKFEIRNCLILGLGGGDAARLVSQKWPESEITGVEIDPLVVKMGKKYFSLDKIPNLKIIIANALTFSDTKKYDLILIDLYLGQNFPKEAESKEFILKLKKLTKKDSIIVFNRFYWGKYKKQTESFKENISKHFSKVWIKRTVSNRLIFCSQ